MNDQRQMYRWTSISFSQQRWTQIGFELGGVWEDYKRGGGLLRFDEVTYILNFWNWADAPNDTYFCCLRNVYFFFLFHGILWENICSRFVLTFVQWELDNVMTFVTIFFLYRPYIFVCFLLLLRLIHGGLRLFGFLLLESI